MRVGLQKTSLIDYPGRVAAVLFTFGCAFRCPYCHNPELVEADGIGDGIAVEDALSFLEKRRQLLSGVVLSGGEPTLHEELPDVAAALRSMGFLVKLDTNGMLPDRIAGVGADYIAMDLKTSLARYDELWPGAPSDASDRLERSIDTIRRSGADYEFRITCVPGFFGESEAAEVAALLEAEDPVYLQRYRPDRVLDRTWASTVSPYTEAELSRLLDILRSAAPKARLRGL